jgi:tripartite-type tricarboxylate transporter receptor subunit TctC
MMRRFATVVLSAALFGVLSLVSALADTYPSRTVFMVVPYPAGGSTDVLARAVANELGELWGRSVVVENVSGASGILGAQKVAKSPPDGYTLMFTIDATVVSNRFLFKTLPYDPDKSFVPITMLARARQLVVAHPEFPANTMRELVEVARKTPVAYASSGPGTTTHLFYEALGRREKAHFVHVPYRGIIPQMTATMSGEVQVSLATAAVVGPNVKAGKLKLLAIGGQNRSSVFPNIETVGEAGYPYVDSVIWWALYAP